MINVVYLVLVLTQSTGTASVTIPQANMAQCQANARIFNTNKNNEIVNNGFTSGVKTQSAICIVGVK